MKELCLIDECVKLAAPPLVASVEEIDAKLDSLKKMRSSLLGFEAYARDEVDKEIVALEGLKTVAGVAAKSVYRKFTTLDMFSWRDRQGLPRIVLFGLDSPNFTIRVRNYSSFDLDYSAKIESPYDLPTKIVQAYEGSLRALWKRVGDAPWRYDSITATCTYKGVIPPEVKAKIKEASKVFGEQVFIMAEGKEWAINKTRAPFMADPLVVGWDGHSLWLVDRFDLTPIERLLATEFVE